MRAAGHAHADACERVPRTKQGGVRACVHAKRPAGIGCSAGLPALRQRLPLGSAHCEPAVKPALEPLCRGSGCVPAV
jgi:hypothetical protein